MSEKWPFLAGDYFNPFYAGVWRVDMFALNFVPKNVHIKVSSTKTTVLSLLDTTIKNPWHRDAKSRIQKWTHSK